MTQIIVKDITVGTPIKSVHSTNNVSVYDNGDVSGDIVINYQYGQFQKMNIVDDITSITVINWPSSTILGRLALYPTTDSTEYSIDWSWVNGWASSIGAPSLAVGLNELLFTTVDGGSTIIGHAIALGIT